MILICSSKYRQKSECTRSFHNYHVTGRDWQNFSSSVEIVYDAPAALKVEAMKYGFRRKKEDISKLKNGRV